MTVTTLRCRSSEIQMTPEPLIRKWLPHQLPVFPSLNEYLNILVVLCYEKVVIIARVIVAQYDHIYIHAYP